MADTDGPRLPIEIRPAQIEIAAGIDREVARRGQLAGSEIDRQSFGDGTEVEQERPMQRDGLSRLVDGHIPEAHVRGRFHDGPVRLAASVLAIESALLQPGADRGVERAIARRGDTQRKANCLEQQPTDRRRRAGPQRQLAEFAVRVEPCTRLFDDPDPFERALDGRVMALNARDAMPGGGTLKIRTSRTTVTAAPIADDDPSPATYVRIDVEDTGQGMTNGTGDLAMTAIDDRTREPQVLYEQPHRAGNSS